MTATEYVILVNEKDEAQGIAEKLKAHQQNMLHRAFSVFIFRTEPTLELLLQQRSFEKYHSPGLWTNTCCSHPRLDENIIEAAGRRLKEELNFTTTLKNIGWFHYNAHFDNGLSENEIDHVLIGFVSTSMQISPNSAEIYAYKWLTIEQLEQNIAANPSQFTPWLAEALALVKKHVS
ncbi:MAG: isopentenyl-diphosphate delta-isomerase [Gammaproteobacteria bacterium RIFCSPHIGHO2_12_FULL_38_14]|nr:MAG: isopentenyl-diphosphate delta-isomerase [Gammaproteobacteria bacterium RIFCSPHIGHO2_12_FULL_38_14]